jgi:hypothetical protein
MMDANTFVCQGSDEPENESEIVLHSLTSPFSCENMDRKPRVLMNTSIPLKQKGGESTRKTVVNKRFIKGAFFSWNKIRGRSNEHSIVENSVWRRGQHLDRDFHVPTPSVSGSAPAQDAVEFETSILAFLVPHKEGQEIVIQDNEHCYEDPANVHSMLTMPSLDLHNVDDGETNVDIERFSGDGAIF